MTLPAADYRRTFSFRAFAVGISAAILMAMWVHFHEVLVPSAGILAENSPPASAIGVFLGVIAIAGLVAAIRPALRLTQAELVVIYSILVVSAPLMSQGMWHRFLGFVVAVPNYRHNLHLLDSYSEKLWPHGPHLIENRRMRGGLGPDMTVEPKEAWRPIAVDESPIGRTEAVELVNRPGEGSDRQKTVLRVRLRRFSGGKEILTPGETYHFNVLVRLEDMEPGSRFAVELVADGGSRHELLVMGRNTDRTFSSPGGFTRAGEPHVSLPRDISEHADLVFRLEGPGRAALTDIVFFNNEALARLFKGFNETRESDYPRLADNARDAVLIRPDNLYSLKGLIYVLKGYVPYGQWAQPMFYWLSIVMAVFLALLSLGVIFRKQWAEHERFSFPLTMLPRLLIEQKDENGRIFMPLFRRKTFLAGAVAALALCAFQGAAYYIPGMPSLKISVKLADYFDSPALKAFVAGMYGGGEFAVMWLVTAIAFFIELDMLLSIVVFFWLAKIPYYFGESMGWKTIRGPLDSFPFPHEQHIGAFLALAVVAVWIARKHLAAVARRALGLAGGADDSGEVMRYRSALALLVASFAFFAAWGRMTGLGAGPSLLFFGFIVLCGFSAARIRTECGAPWTYFTPYFPYLLFFLFGGLKTFRTETLLLAYFAGGFMAVAQFLMFAPSQVEMMHLGGQYRARPSGVGWGLVAGVLAGVLIGGYVMLVWAYGVGGENITYMRDWAIHQDWYFSSLRNAVAEANARDLAAAAAQSAEAAKPAQAGPITAVGVGAVVTGLLAFLRIKFVGFWLHPIGYVLANSYFAPMCWGSLFAAWIIKSVGLRLGGPRFIREHMTPFFGGVACGCVAGMFAWDIVGVALMASGQRDIFTCWP